MFETKNKSDYTLSLVKFKRNKYTILLFDSSNEKIISDKCGWNCKTVHSNFLIINFYRNNLDNQYNEYLLAKKNNLPIVKLGVDDYGQGLNISGIIVKIYIDIKKLSIPMECIDLNVACSNERSNMILKENFLNLIEIDLFYNDNKIDCEYNHRCIFRDIIISILKHEQSKVVYDVNKKY